jgi:hypothetical protein
MHGDAGNFKKGSVGADDPRNNSGLAERGEFLANQRGSARRGSMRGGWSVNSIRVTVHLRLFTSHRDNCHETVFDLIHDSLTRMNLFSFGSAPDLIAFSI